MKVHGTMSVSRSRLVVAAALAVATLSAACVGTDSASDVTTFRFAHPLATPGTSHDKIIMEEFPRAIDEATDGAVQIEPIVGVIENEEVLTALAEGRIEMAAVSMSYLDQTRPMWAVLDLPGLQAEKYPRLAAEIANDIVRPVWEEDLEEWGISVGAVMTFAGSYFLSNGPVDSVDDFEGMRYRTSTGQLTNFITGLGGAPVGLEFAELQGALERGIVDAFTVSMSILRDSPDLLDAVTYVETWPHGVGTYALLYSDEALSELDQALQEDILAEFDALQRTLPERQGAEAEAALKAVINRGLELATVPTAEYNRAVAIAREQVWESWLEATGDRGQQLMADVRQRFAEEAPELDVFERVASALTHPVDE